MFFLSFWVMLMEPPCSFLSFQVVLMEPLFFISAQATLTECVIGTQATLNEIVIGHEPQRPHV
jgi:hypothetical protein